MELRCTAGEKAEWDCTVHYLGQQQHKVCNIVFTSMLIQKKMMRWRSDMQQIWTCQALNSKEANELDGLKGLGKNLQHANFVVHIQKLWAPSYSVETLIKVLWSSQPCGRDGGDYSSHDDSDFGYTMHTCCTHQRY
ncbi:uncharacterized protein LOC135614729 [Musa acuminata AAA Group]|uniref:uncharacterized protein LOC135614729 n=1 Tax=Musa acuminata AAA Group TaxID=214697 RepID=UPI0031DEE044